MIIKVNKKIEAIKSDKELQLPEDLRKEIEKFWEEQYREYKEILEQKGEDVEFAKLHFIKKEKALETLESLNNPKRPYLESLIVLDSTLKQELER